MKRITYIWSIIALTSLWLPAQSVTQTLTYMVLHAFTGGADGAQPSAGLIRDAAGNLYGTTFLGGGTGCGGSGCGVVWKLKHNPNGTWTASILHAFTGADGAWPYLAGVIFDSAGNLYGTTMVGGSSGDGVVFRLKPNLNGSWTESVLHNFTGADGALPRAGLIFDSTGNLYGTTNGGGTNDNGVVFKLQPNPDGTWTQSVLHKFSGADGSSPQAGLIFDAAGNLYGTTANGGTFTGETGVVFKLQPNPDGTWTESVLYSFTGAADGGFSFAGLTFDAAGNLYGTTTGGGTHGYGVVFRLKPNPDGTWTESVLYSFAGGADGGVPWAPLIFDATGNLYGTANDLGSAACTFGCGVVFKLVPTPSGWSETVLHSFAGEDGSSPTAPLIFDPAGNLYGTASSGTTNSGVVFEITGFGIPFSSFAGKLELDLDAGSFDLNSNFALGPGGSINPPTQPVSLTIGTYSVTIPAGSFVKHREGYAFQGVINGVSLEVLIKFGSTPGSYSFLAEGRGANLKGTTNPVTVTLSIGNDLGTSQIHAEFE